MRSPSLDELNECRDIFLAGKSLSYETVILQVIMERNDTIERHRLALGEIAIRPSWKCNVCGYDYEDSGWKEAPLVCPRCETAYGHDGCILLRPATKAEIKAAVLEAKI